MTDLIKNSEEEARQKLKVEVEQSETHDIDALAFCKEHPDKCIKKLRMNKNQFVEVTEHAPKLFSLIGRGVKSE